MCTLLLMRPILKTDLQIKRKKLFGFGFGFGLITKAGLFKLNYTTGKTEGTNFKLSDSKIHLSLSTTF